MTPFSRCSVDGSAGRRSRALVNHTIKLSERTHTDQVQLQNDYSRHVRTRGVFEQDVPGTDHCIQDQSQLRVLSEEQDHGKIHILPFVL